VSYITLRDLWCDIIVLNVNALNQDKSDDTKDSFHEKLERVLDQFSKCCLKMLLYVNGKVGRGDILEPTI
jgi:hypothetical protein